MNVIKFALIALSVLLAVDTCRKKNTSFDFVDSQISVIKFSALAIWCYRCNSATPGCSDNFNWRGIGFLGEHCPEDDDICVKVVERKGGAF